MAKGEKNLIKSNVKIWGGVFQTFEEANRKKTDIENNVWNNSIWMEKQLKRQKDTIEKLSESATISKIAQTDHYCLPFFVAALKKSIDRPRVLDFGGGLATTYLYLRSMMPEEESLSYTIVENIEICKHGNELFKEDDKIRFIDKLPEKSEFNIIHLGSSMHYIENWRELIGKFYEMRPQYLIFADLPAGDIETFVTNQNFNGTNIPVRFWNISEFIAQVEEFGFKLLLKSRYHSNYLDSMRSLPEKYRLNYFSQLVFSL